MANNENLKKGKATQFKSGEQAANAGRKGGIKSGQAKKAKKNMRQIAQTLLSSPVSKDMKNVKNDLERMGIEPTEQTYQAAIVARLVGNAMATGDVGKIRYLQEMIGEQDDGSEGSRYPQTVIPDNGRDK